MSNTNTEEKKSNTQLLRELQDVVDRFSEKKRNVEVMLNEIDELEKQYHVLVKKIKKQ